MNTPCLVTRDLNAYLRQQASSDAAEDRLETLAAERFQWLTEEAKGVGEITQALYQDEAGSPLDEALFSLYQAWSRQQPTAEAMRRLLTLIDQKAQRLAEQWALETLQHDREDAAEAAVEAARWEQTA